MTMSRMSVLLLSFVACIAVASLSKAAPILKQGTGFEFSDDYCDLLNSLANTKGYALPADAKVDAAAALDGARKYVIDALESIPISNFPTWNVPEEAVPFATSFLRDAPCAANASTPAFDFHPYMKSIEGPILAPISHTIVFEDPKLQVISFHLPAHTREPYHTHLYFSMLIKVHNTKDQYWTEDGTVAGHGAPFNASEPLGLSLMAPEWLHSVDNLDDEDYHAVRIEFFPVSQIAYMWPSV